MATSPSFYGDYSDAQQPTLATVADVISAARTRLQDVLPPYRYDDSTLLDSLNIALTEAARLRADLFAYNLVTKGQVPSFQNIDDTKLGVEVPFRQAMVLGTVGQTYLQDQEDYQNALATSFLNMFTQILIGRGLGPVMGGAGPGRP